MPNALSERTRQRIRELLAQGTPRSQIAKTLGLARQSVYNEIARLKHAGTVEAVAGDVIARRERKVPSEQQTAKLAEAGINVVSELSWVVTKAKEVIGKLEETAAHEGWDSFNAEAAFKGLAEVRQSAEAFAKIAELLHSAQEVREFQQEVLAAIDEEAPEVAAKIRRAIEQRRNVRLAARGTG